MINENTLAENIRSIKARIEQAAASCGRNSSAITIVGATKTVPVETIHAAFLSGINHFGENYVQEAKSKKDLLAKLEVKPTWHMIGHLQTNKVKNAVELFDAIETVNSVRLAETIAGKAIKKPMPIMLQVNITGETGKFGFAPKEVVNAYKTLKALPELSITGLMTIAPVLANQEEVRPFFRRLRQLRDSLGLHELSMGMTGDFEVAIQEGATIVRIGRALFGQRR
ncbi:YggS family pyridoxal phosphate-dependent enzyme [Candidatus Microgenomates bacterium]|nr:YggS family pyridoxal phosphate-dependent enzyme [Candidatus Microgenomates bacterium]